MKSHVAADVDRLETHRTPSVEVQPSESRTESAAVTEWSDGTDSVAVLERGAERALADGEQSVDRWRRAALKRGDGAVTLDVIELDARRRVAKQSEELAATSALAHDGAVRRGEADAVGGRVRKERRPTADPVDRVLRPVVRRLADIEAKPLAWSWLDRIPRGMVTLIAGEPGTGKSTLAYSVVAALTKGLPLPDDEARPPTDVVILSCEESPEYMIRPRLEAMGADPRRVHILDGIENLGGTLPLTLAETKHVDVIRDAIRDSRASMVLIDVLSGYATGVDYNRPNEMRAIMSSLRVLAEETTASVVAITHLNRGASTSVSAQVMGSTDIIGAARCALITGRDPDAPANQRAGIVARGKANLPGHPQPWAYSIDPEIGVLTWVEPRPEVTPEQLLAPPALGGEDDGSKMDEAAEWLRQALADGERHAEDVQREARKREIAERTLRRARKQIGVQIDRRGFGRGSYSAWSLRQPESRGDDPEDVNVRADRGAAVEETEGLL
jgi:putative DNA primase/helicase